jgi:hypothetical protein
MPRFYFDVRHDERVTHDTEGEEHPDIAAAEREAAVAAAHLAKELLDGSRRTVAVEVRDERGRHVVRAEVSLDIVRS